VLARRYGVGMETIRKRRKRGPEDGLDRLARPHRLPGKASEDERAGAGVLMVIPTLIPALIYVWFAQGLLAKSLVSGAIRG
jgi:hypothetical protein